MNVLYRNFTLADYAQCAEIWKENEQYTESKSLHCMEKAVAISPNFQWVAECNGKVVGFIGASFDGRIVFVYGFSVKREYQNNGIGTHLMSIIEELASENGAVEIVLFTKKTRERTKQFYGKRNYSGSGEHEVFSKALANESYAVLMNSK